MKDKFKYIVIVVVLIISLLIGFNEQFESSKPLDNILEVYFIDVGQGDSILVRVNDNNMLIDAGNNVDGELLVNYFKELGINSFEYVVGTHPHEDHIGGLDNVIDNFEIKNIFLPDVTTTLRTFTDLLDSIEKNEYEITVPK